jgi:hypothetical protein
MLYNKRVGAVALLLGVLCAVAAVACTIRVLQDNEYLRSIAARVCVTNNPEQDAIRLLHFVHRTCENRIDPRTASFTARLESTLPSKLSPVTILKEGFTLDQSPGAGPCAAMSRTMVALAKQHGWEARKVMLSMGGPGGDHCMAAIWIDHDWRLFDPSIDFCWTNRDGHIASIKQIQQDETIFAQVFKVDPDYAYRFDNLVYFRWAKLGPEAAPVKSALAFVTGEEWVANFEVPRAYRRPFMGYGYVSGILAFLLLGWAWDGWRRRRQKDVRDRRRSGEAVFPVLQRRPAFGLNIGRSPR